MLTYVIAPFPSLGECYWHCSYARLTSTKFRNQVKGGLALLISILSCSRKTTFIPRELELEHQHLHVALLCFPFPSFSFSVRSSIRGRYSLLDKARCYGSSSLGSRTRVKKASASQEWSGGGCCEESPIRLFAWQIPVIERGFRLASLPFLHIESQFSAFAQDFPCLSSLGWGSPVPADESFSESERGPLRMGSEQFVWSCILFPQLCACPLCCCHK